MLTEKDAKDLVEEYGQKVNEGRTIKQIIKNTDLPRLIGTSIQEGKVSDSVFGDNLNINNVPLRLMYRSNRISTHDENRGEIPFKDQILALNHNFMLNLVRYTIGTSQFDIPNLEPTSTVIAAENLELFKFENVFRMYMAQSSTKTSLYQHWLKAKEEKLEVFNYSGYKMFTDNLSSNCKLPYLMDTPSTKDEVDETVSPKYLIDNGICTLKEYDEIKDSSTDAFCIVSDYLQSKNMVLVDTKTEHGKNLEGKIVSADELYTMDSSRFWKINEDGSLMINDKDKPVSFSKEFARGMIKEKGQVFTQEQSNEIAVRYILGYQHLTGQEFVPDLRKRDERIIDSTNLILDYLL